MKNTGKTAPFWRRLHGKCFLKAFSIAASVLLYLNPAVSFAETKIYFYNPDANLKDVAKLKSDAQDYFKKADSDISLTAFIRLEDLIAAMKSNPPDFLVAASWFTKNQAIKSGYKPLLVGHVGASKSYSKVLISKQAGPVSDTPSLSMVSYGEKNVESLSALVPEIKKYKNVNIVEVSKDIDAVLAVSFGQVDMALVRQQNVDAIKKVNESAVANLKTIAKSAPIEYPILSASPKASPATVEKIVKSLQSPEMASQGTALDLMGFEGWTNR